MEKAGDEIRSRLRNIQRTVASYAGIISKIAGVDVEVVDDNLYRVAGTGMFAAGVDASMAQCTCQQKLDTKLKKSGIKNESMYKIHQLF